MPSSVISVENVSKRYLVGHQAVQRDRYSSLRDIVAHEAQSFVRKAVDLVHGRQIVQGDEIEEFWALKDVSFKVKKGDVLGVVGRNGAGKSTLLKILSRITEPTKGRIAVHGRVASLLEVGTGFHPELSGRENIFLNGAILGMTQREIQKKFDEIVAFAEVERFLDTPVKRYSSGMYVRLAFAVAAHLEPEILLIDEVLAVGDAAFQKKCLGKLESVATNEGRTVVFISHNTNALLTLCKRGVLLGNGSVVLDGDIKEVVEQYYSHRELHMNASFAPQIGKPSITAVSIDKDALNAGDLVVDIAFTSPFPMDPPVPGIVINSNLGIPIYGSNPRIHDIQYSGEAAVSGAVQFKVRQLPLVDGHYSISVWLGDWHKDYDRRLDVLSFKFHRETPQPRKQKPESVGLLDWPAEWRLL
jgi:lipopolysaccharide transport system ATP-binding protein